MTERQLQNAISVSLILAHFLILLLLLVAYLLGGLKPGELKDSLSIVVPMLGALTGLAVNYVIGVKTKKKMLAASHELSGIYVFTALFLPGLFVLTIAMLVVMKALNRGISSPDQFKTALAAAETIFGLYTGKVLGSLFEKRRSE